MSLNKSKGNMYPFIDFTQNFIKGKCEHDCVYCYMKNWGEPKPVRFDEKEFKDFKRDMDLYGENQFIFVGSSTDMFASNISLEWQERILNFLREFDNKYLFQTKNPTGIRKLEGHFPTNSLIGVTIESNRPHEVSKAMKPMTRMDRFSSLHYKKMISIEPILDFDLDQFVQTIHKIMPEFVSIGACSNKKELEKKGIFMEEPDTDKVKALIKELAQFTKVIQKSNLGRLL